MYLGFSLTCILFFTDLAIERFADFQTYERKPEFIELVWKDKFNIILILIKFITMVLKFHD